MGRVLGAGSEGCLQGGVLASGGGDGSLGPLGLFLADVAISLGGTALCGSAFGGVLGRGDGASAASGRALGWGEASRLRLVLAEGLAFEDVVVVAGVVDARTGTGVSSGKYFFSVQIKAHKPAPGPKAQRRGERSRKPLLPLRNLRASGKPRKGDAHSSRKPSARGHGWHPAWTPSGARCFLGFCWPLLLRPGN